MEFGSDWGGKDYYEKPKEKIKEKSKEKIEDRPQERKDDISEEELKKKELEEKIKEQDEKEKRESKEHLEKLKEETEKKKKLKEVEESQKRKEIDERITKDEKDNRRQEELNDKDKEKVSDETKDIESEKFKEKIDNKEKEEVHEEITKKEIEEYRKEIIEAIKVLADGRLLGYFKEFSIEKKISANKGTEIRPEFKEYIEKLNDGFIAPYRESLLEKCDAIKEKHLFDKYIIDILYNADNPLEFISNYEKHTGLEIGFGTIEQIAKENNIGIKISAEPIHKDINEAEVSEIQTLSIENRELKKQILDLQEIEHNYCNKIYNLEKEKLEKETREIEVLDEYKNKLHEITEGHPNDYKNREIENEIAELSGSHGTPIKIPREKKSVKILPKNSIKVEKITISKIGRINKEINSNKKENIIDKENSDFKNINENITNEREMTSKFDIEQNQVFKFTNLMDREVQKIFKEYVKIYKKNANYGLRLTKRFLKWINHKENVKVGLIKKFYNINTNKEIEKFVAYKYEYCNLDINKI